MPRRALAPALTLALTAGLLVVPALTATAHAAAPARELGDQGAWVAPRTVDVDGPLPAGYGLTSTQDYGPAGWETFYVDRAQQLRDIRVQGGPEGALTPTAVPLPVEASSWFEGRGGVFDVDVDPDTGDAVACGRGPSTDGDRAVVFTTRTGSDGDWSALRNAAAPSGFYSSRVACAVGGGKVVVAAATTSVPDDQSHYGTEPLQVGGAAATTTLVATDDVLLADLVAPKPANVSGVVRDGGTDGVSGVAAAAGNGGLMVATMITTRYDADTTDDVPAVLSSTTTLTTLGPGDGSDTVLVRSDTLNNGPHYGDLKNTTVSLADLGGTTVSVTDPYISARVQGSVVTVILDGRRSDGSPAYDSLTAVPQARPGVAWVLHAVHPDPVPTLWRITAGNLRMSSLPTSTGFVTSPDDDGKQAPLDFNWYLDDAFRPAASGPDGSVWVGLPCDPKYACVVRYQADGSQVGRVEATANEVLPTSATTGEGLLLTGDQPVGVHFDSDAPVDDRTVDPSGITVSGATPRSDGSYVLADGSATLTFSATTTDATTGDGSNLLHSWTVDGTPLDGQDFDAGSGASVQYTFTDANTFVVTHQAQDQAGNRSTPSSRVLKIVEPGAPLDNFGPVLGVTIGEQSAVPVTKPGTVPRVNVPVSWTPLAGADGYAVRAVDPESGPMTTQTLPAEATATTLDVPASDAVLTVQVTPFKTDEGPGSPGTATFTPLDITAPYGAYDITPSTGWARVTTVTVTQKDLDDRDAAKDLTRTISWGDGTATATWATPATSTTITKVYAKAGTFQPVVTLTDTKKNSRTITLPPVTVRTDTLKPTVTITRPAKASLSAAAAWRTLRGTAKDAQTGVTSLGVEVVQKRGTKWYAYSFTTKRWSSAQPTLARAQQLAQPVAPTSVGSAWTAPTIVGLTKGTLVVTAVVTDRAGNRSTATANQVLTR